MVDYGIERRHPDAICELCPLYKKDTFTGNLGNKDSNVVFVGKSPTVFDSKMGQPFAGTSGKLLKKVLKKLGQDPEELYFTNLVLCASKSPTKQAIRACKPRLLKDIESADTIVTLGKIQDELGAPNESIYEARLKSPRILDGKKFISTYSPAAVYNFADRYPDFCHDLEKINSPVQEQRSISYTVIEDSYEAVEFLEGLPANQVVTIDIETRIDKDTETYNPTQRDLLCIGIGYNDYHAYILGKDLFKDKDPEFIKSLKFFFENNRIVAHNGKFDLNGISSFIGQDHTAALWFDTLLASYACDERPGTNALGYLSREILGVPNWKEKVKGKYLSVIPRNTLYSYNASDVANTYALYKYYKSLLNEKGLEKLFRYLIRSSNTLMKIERNGVSIDIRYLYKLRKRYVNKQRILLQRIQNLVRDPQFNPNSPAQVRSYFEFKGFTIQNAQAQTIERYTDHSVMGPYVKLHLEYKKNAKILSTYVNGIINRLEGEKVYTTYKLHGTVTGRLSSSNPNLQNIPRGSELRNLFAAKPGHILLKIDYSQAELRAMAWMAQDYTLRDIYLEGRDIHGEVAANVFGPDWTKEHRQMAKVIVYGLSYGMTASSLSRRLEVKLDVAKSYIHNFFKMIPQTAKWFKTINKEILTKRQLVSPFGYIRRFHLITPINRNRTLRMGISFLPQNIISNMTLEAANKITDLGYGNMIRLLVHDELVFEVPEQDHKLHARNIKILMEQIGTELFEGYIPAVADVSVGYRWGEMTEMKIDTDQEKDIEI